MVQTLAAFVGLEAGDEGKGKIVDECVISAQKQSSGKRTVVVRFQGGANAGHTIFIPKKDGTSEKFVAHVSPSGIVNNADIAIGPGVAFDPEKFIQELSEAKRLFNYSGKIMISERTGILFDYHRKLDAHMENSAKNIGTTKSGIGPFYEDNARRLTRITFYDYISANFPNKLKEVLEIKKEQLTKADILTDNYVQELIELHNKIRKELLSFSERLGYRLRDYLKNGDNIIIEGAQGTMLDVDMGTIPDVTSSHLLAPYAFASLGLSRKLFKVYGVEKTYPTRVGNGILPTLSTDGFGDIVGERAQEFGASTGRRRRVGYPDWVFVKRSVFLNDCDGIFLTRVDNVQDLNIKVCTAYKINGEIIDEVPLDLNLIREPIYLKRKFKWHLWDQEVASDPKKLAQKRADYIKKGFNSLPSELLDFIKAHDEYVGCHIVGVSIGPNRGDTILREDFYK